MTTRQMTMQAPGRPPIAISRKRHQPADYVPKDFAEMYRSYYTYVFNLLYANGISYQDADDVAQSIFMTLDAKGFLDDFDPTKEFNGRPAVFTTFLSGAVLKYLRHYRHRNNVRIHREGQSTDETVVAHGADSSDMWIDVHGPHFEEEYSDLHGDDFRRQIRAHLATASTGRKDNQLDLVALFNEINHQVETDGKYTTAELGRVFGVSRTTIHNWLERLRIEVSKVVDNG